MEVEEYKKNVRKAIELYQKGAYEECIRLSEILVSAKPERPGAYEVCARALQRENRIDEIEVVLTAGLKNTSETSIKYNLAVVKSELGKHEEAIALFQELPKEPIDSKIHFYYAKSLSSEGNDQLAAIEYLKCINLDPSHKSALNNLANIYQNWEQLEDAIRYYKALVSYYPEDAIAINNLAGIFEKQQKIDLAASHYEKARQIDPSLSIIYFNLGQLYLNQLGRPAKALEVFEEGIDKGDQQYRKGLNFYRIICKQHLLDWSDYEADSQMLTELINDNWKKQDSSFSIIPYSLSHSPIDKQLFKQVAKYYASSLKNRTQKIFDEKAYSHSLSSGKIKVGYYSPNVRKHPGGLLIRQLFDYHNASIFEIHMFSLVHTDDFVNQEIRDSVDFYHNVSDLSAKDIADLINRTGIDILVALGAYNTFMKFEVLAARPAPIQMVMLEYHETTGADYVDYVFTDEYMVSESLRKNYTEKLITLPCSLLVNSELPIDTTIKSQKVDHGLPEDAFIFASFNHPRKIDPDTFQAWCEILHQTPGSILWLYLGGMDAIPQSLKDILATFKIDYERLILAKSMDLDHHLARIRHADLILDCFQYNGHFTNVEALRMGVPFISVKGNDHNSMLGSSLLHYANLEELICLNRNDYITRSIELFENRHQINDLKQRLIDHDNNKVFDSEMQVRYLEKAFVKAYLKEKKGLPPEDFDVNATLSIDSFDQNKV